MERVLHGNYSDELASGIIDVVENVGESLACCGTD